MVKMGIRQAVLFVLLAGILTGCMTQNQTENNGENSTAAMSEEQNTEITVNAGEEASQSDVGDRPLLIKAADNVYDNNVVPNVEPYTIEPDLSNVDNVWQFYLQEGEMADKLSQNGFVVCGNAGREFFEIYEMNRYELRPNFITVDSLMHTYHLYFGYLLKNIEKEYLIEDITSLSKMMLAHSIEQYDKLKGSEWENAALRNVAFFTVGAKLLDESTEVEDYAAIIAGGELDKINQASEISPSEITGAFEDYTQYIPRGYYEGDERLKQYFKAMMWYGRIHFEQEEEDMDRSALLIAKALTEDSGAYELWESVYAVTSFFAGASDDLGVCEYAPIIRKVYGECTVDDLIGNQDAFHEFHTMTAALSAPSINSIPIEDGEDNVIPGFRFMGQRFTIDASIMQRLIYSDVKESSEGEKRMLPDVLDVPAALGSELALDILKEKGAADYKGYMENMEKLKESLSEENDTLWSASLYANWLNTLRPLLTVKGEGYPVFMQNEEWSKKNLECFAGSFTELKHDTILYSKQVIAEMGGGYEEEPDYRGYVEPEPLVYARFVNLTDLTGQGLEEYGMLSKDAQENLSRLSQIAGQLLTISEKELRDEVLTDDEYEFIADYGGNIEHFWYEAIKDDGGEISAQTYPAAIVADIATNPNGEVLEVATGDPSIIYVVVKVDGKIKIASGSVYSFYQFSWPLEDRLTDTKWRQMIGIQPDADGNYNYDMPVKQPDWTESYRYE